MLSVEKIDHEESSLGHHSFINNSRLNLYEFMNTHGDKTGAMHSLFTLAKIHDKGKKWFIWYQFRDKETGKMKRYRIYHDLNRLKGKEKEDRSIWIRDAVNHYMRVTGKNPAEKRSTIFTKSYSFLQSLSYFKQKLPDLGLRKKTTDSYSSFLSMFDDYSKEIHHTPIDEINKTQAQNLLSELKRDRKWGNTMYNNALTFGRLLFSFLIQNSITKENPFKQVKPLPEQKTGNKPFSDADFKLIKEKAPKDLLRFLTFLYFTGTRPNEARQLTYENIDYKRKVLLVPSKLAKSRKDGWVPVPDEFLSEFKGQGVIFGKSRNYYGAKFTELKRELKLDKDYTLYSIKATRAIHLAEDGASPYAIMQLFRHSSLDVTMEYLRGIGLNIGREASDKARKI